jgi:hypothetical protein
MTKTIAVDLDDTLNDFTQTLRRTEFTHGGKYSFSSEVFDAYLQRLKGGRDDVGDPGDLLATEFSFFKNRIHQECYGLARARPDGVDFMRWLRADGWRIVICTYRDLRRSNDATRAWLADNGIPFDYLFMAWNKIVFCRAWGIEHLVDDHPFNSVHGARHGVKVYYPATPEDRGHAGHGARAFASFGEIKPWIQG